MIFNDTTSAKQGIVQDVYFGVSANANTYPIADLTRNANEALDIAFSKILGADGKWQFDSSNAVDLPIGYTDLISGQQDYSFEREFLVLTSPLQILARDGLTWIELEPTDDNLLQSTVTGDPVRYNKLGRSFLLDPIPDYSFRLANESKQGLRGFFQLNIDRFETTDTTKEPGFDSNLHGFVSVWCQWKYAKAKGLVKRLPDLEKELIYYLGNEDKGGNEVGQFKIHYSYREKDKRGNLNMHNEVLI